MYKRLPLYCVVLLVLFRNCWSTLSLEPAVRTVVKYTNESYIVTCSTDKYNDIPRESFKWLKNNNTWSPKHHPNVDLENTLKSSMLIFNRILMIDKGDYTCIYKDLSQTFKLIVVDPIDFDGTPTVQTIQENRLGDIKCLVNGDPQPKIMWKFGGEDLNTNTHLYDFLPDGLRIRNVSIDDKGMYTCRAIQMSPITSMYDEVDIYVNVQHKPLLRRLPVHAKVNQAYGIVGGMVNLTCEAVAEPAASFFWFRQHRKKIPGKIIEQPHWSILQILIENSSTFGDYMCQAKNSLGTLEQIITLSEGIQPPAPIKLLLRAAGDDFLELELLSPKINHTMYTTSMLPVGYRLQYRVRGAKTKWEESMIAEFDDYTENDNNSYFLTKLAGNTVYEVRAATRNAAGLSEYTIPRTFRTLELRAETVTSPAYKRILPYQIALVIVSCLLLETN